MALLEKNLTPREALTTSAIMMLGLSLMGPWGIALGYAAGEIINRAVRKGIL